MLELSFILLFYLLVQNTAVVVLDSVPGEVTSGNSDGEVEKVLQTLKSLPSTVPSRK